MTATKPVALVDCSNIINRAYHVAKLYDADVQADRVLSMATSMIARYLREAGDIDARRSMLVYEGKESWRKAIYPEYKGGRKGKEGSLPDALAQGPEYLKESLGMRLKTVEGYEADDVMASYADALDNEFYTAVLISNDSDLLQCLTANIHCGVPKQGGGLALMGPADFRDKYGFRCGLFPDYKALMGEKGDNITGVDQIGKVTAAKALAAYGGIESIYNLIDQRWPNGSILTPKQIGYLVAGREVAQRNIKLTTLLKNVPGCELKGTPQHG